VTVGRETKGREHFATSFILCKEPCFFFYFIFFCEGASLYRREKYLFGIETNQSSVFGT
jgi:hypothetical protein